MKYIKYLVLSLVVAMMGSSCEKQEVEFPWKGTEGKALCQVYYVAPLASTSANYIHNLVINNVSYSDNHASYLTPMSRRPHNSSAATPYFAVNPGQQSIQMYNEKLNSEGEYDSTEKYNQTTAESLEAGKNYHLFVHDLNKAPIVVEEGKLPVYNNVDSLGSAFQASIRFANMMYDSMENPMVNKLRIDFKDKKGGTVIQQSPAIGFGEVTDWMTVTVHKSIFNSSGYESLYHDIVEVDANGNDVRVVVADDYWTTYIGRAVYWLMAGSADTNPVKAGITLFYIL